VGKAVDRLAQADRDVVVIINADRTGSWMPAHGLVTAGGRHHRQE